MDRLRIGVVGCGSISETYLRNARLFRRVEMRACADLSPEAAMEKARQHGIEARSVDALIASDDIDLILNLTVPNAHFAVSMDALAHGKHVFTEKPLAATLAEGRILVETAKASGLQIGSAPDTFLGAAGRRARRLINEGLIGRPITGTAVMMSAGMEGWHPNPAFYFQPGAGPLFDMGPYYLTQLVQLLGPAESAAAMAATGHAERTIGAGPRKGATFPVNTPTTYAILLKFRSGAVISLVVSFDVVRHSLPPIEIHGTAGSMRLPDPDTFGGDVALALRDGDWQVLSTRSDVFGAPNWQSPLAPDGPVDRANYRMLGLTDLVFALEEGRAPRASGALALHVLEIMDAITRAADTGATVIVEGTADQPAALPEAEAGSFLKA